MSNHAWILGKKRKKRRTTVFTWLVVVSGESVRASLASLAPAVLPEELDLQKDSFRFLLFCFVLFFFATRSTPNSGLETRVFFLRNKSILFRSMIDNWGRIFSSNASGGAPCARLGAIGPEKMFQNKIFKKRTLAPSIFRVSSFFVRKKKVVRGASHGTNLFMQSQRAAPPATCWLLFRLDAHGREQKKRKKRK